MPSLVLYPGDPHWRPEDTAALSVALQQEGLLAAGCAPDAPGAFAAGEHFLQLVMFLGCSPQVALSADDASNGTPLCTIRFNESAAVRFMASGRHPAPRCPHCRTALTVAAPVVDACVTCPGCGTATPMQDLDWRQSAGFARFFIELAGIYPHEALPADRLLEHLRRFSHCDWKYFYKN